MSHEPRHQVGACITSLCNALTSPCCPSTRCCALPTGDGYAIWWLQRRGGGSHHSRVRRRLPPSPQHAIPEPRHLERPPKSPASPAQLSQAQQAATRPPLQHQGLPQLTEAGVQCDMAEGRQQVLQNRQMLVQLANRTPPGQHLLQLAAATSRCPPTLQLVGTMPESCTVMQLASPVLGTAATGHMLQLADGQQLLHLGSGTHSGVQLVQLTPVGTGSLQPGAAASVVQHSRLQGPQSTGYLLIPLPSWARATYASCSVATSSPAKVAATTWQLVSLAIS